MSVPRIFSSRRTTRVLGGTLLVLMVSAGAAEAASVSTTGAKASNSGKALTIADTKADGNNAYANWNNSTGNRVETSGGNGSSSTVTPSTLTSFRACIDVSGGFDTCSSWVTP